MANPFYVEPGNNFLPGLSALNQGIQQYWAKKKEDELKAKYETIKAGAVKAYQSNDPDQIAEYAIQNPEVSQILTEQAKFRSEQTKQNFINSGYSILADPSPENVRRIVSARQAFLRSQGQTDEDMPFTMGFEEKYTQDPEKAVQELKMDLAAIDPKRWEAFSSATNGKKEDIPDLQQNYERAKSEGFEGDFMQYQRAIKSDPAQDLEMQKLKIQIADIQERQIERQQKVEENKKIKDDKTKKLVSSIDNAIDETDKAISQAKNSITSTGVIGALTSKIPTSPAYNLRKRIDTVKANLGFDQLQKMRDASPTGGALGQVSERELMFLQNTITALDPNMGDDELIANLEKVKKHYNNWRKTVIGELPEGYEIKPPKIEAPQQAIDYLKQHPEFKKDFETKYGYLPEGF